MRRFLRPGADKARVGLLCLFHQGALLLAQLFDAVGPRRTGCVPAAPGLRPCLQLHLPLLHRHQGRTGKGVVLLIGEQMPGQHRDLACGCDLSAWLGLVPRQATTGGKPKLLGITKRGSKYLRKLIIQGARSALPSLARTSTPLGAWLRGLLARAHGNTVVVALASKLARIAWALLRTETGFTAAGSAAA